MGLEPHEAHRLLVGRMLPYLPKVNSKDKEGKRFIVCNDGAVNGYLLSKLKEVDKLCESKGLFNF